MRLDDMRASDNVEDLRGQSARGGGMMLGGGLGTLLLIVVVMLLGGDPRALLDMAAQQGGMPMPQTQEAGPYQSSPNEDQLVEEMKRVLGSTEEVWTEQFARLGRQYTPPKMRIFTGSVRSGCGFASSQVGPFYCPADQVVYLDLSFFDEMKHKFGASGDFAQAYVVAHEVGHHVQNLLGIADQVNNARQRMSEVEANALSVRMELQADFLAGVWAHKAQEKYRFLEEGDIEEAMNAAHQIGDDTLQRQATGHVVPDAFTHGTSAQRMKWFRKGLETGDIRQGDTFSARDL